MCELCFDDDRQLHDYCEQCGRFTPLSGLHQTLVTRQTMREPAVYARRCASCLRGGRGPLTRAERLAALADRGVDTWDEYQGER